MAARRFIVRGRTTESREGTMTRLFLAVAIAITGAFAGAQAQDWPSKPVRLIVPVTAGSAIDITTRAVGDQLSRQLNQTFIVENRAGAGTTLGSSFVAKSDPDGSTILFHSSAITIHPSTFPKLGIDTVRDFAGIMPIVNVPLILIASPQKHKTLAGLVEKAKAMKGAMNYATVGYGAAAHLTAERLRLSAGFEAQQIPFKGAPEAINEVLAGRVDFFFTPILPALGLLRDGKLVALATSSPTRAQALPDVPTTLEAGYRDSDYAFWIGMFVPKKTPRPVVDRIYAETLKATQAPDVQARFRKLGGEPMKMTPAEFDALIAREQANNAKLVKAAGIKPN
jgi:tripartite-type tricarboxylate transporter receptor subunit TctC